MKWIELHCYYGGRRIILNVDHIKSILDTRDNGKIVALIYYGDTEDSAVMVTESYEDIKEALEENV